MKMPEELFKGWKESFRSPDDSIFYYHTELERVLLSLAIFTISSGPIFRKIGKDDPLSLLNTYITDLITAWIDEDDEAFEQMFQLTMPIADAYVNCVFATQEELPSKKEELLNLANFYSYAVACGGDMPQELADSLLDDLSTDGERLLSPKIKKLGTKILKLMQTHGHELLPLLINELNGWKNDMS